jgi:hypothetical protein
MDKKMSAFAFYQQAFMAFQRYSLDNAWFDFQKPGGKFDMQAPVSYIFAAYGAYEKVYENPTKITLLGDTKLRTDYDLVMNFGLSSARGVQEEECRKFIQDLQNERQKIKDLEPIKDPKILLINPEAKGGRAIPVEGAGAILSTQKWSPMLNDSFIMAGIHYGHDFALALTGDEIVAYDSLVSQTDDKERWRLFFLKSPGSLWSESKVGSFPRVLMRELIGLMTFGYEPRFDKSQLGFKAMNAKAADESNLSAYLTALSNLRFQEKDKAKCMGAIAKFLFGSEGALQA